MHPSKNVNKTKMTAETETAKNITKTFKYSFPTCSNEDVLLKLEVPVEIPHAGSTRELVQRVINMFHIPVYLEDELNDKLAQFVSEETENFHNDRDEKLINQLKNSELNVEGIVKNWEKAFKENVMEFAEQKGTSDEEVFAAAYHKLVHSPACETILSVEHSYAKTFQDLRQNRDVDIKQLTAKQTEEMEEKVHQLNITTTEEEINELATVHFEEQALVAGRWDSQLDALWQTQRAQFRAWLMSTLDDYQTTTALNTPTNSPLGTFEGSTAGAGAGAGAGTGAPSAAPRPRLEESFTIHLGSQLKQTHNIRIVAADVLELCVPDPRDNGDGGRRLQTSLGLYSSELCAVVLAAESPPARPAPPSSLLAAAAATSTDHHFEHVDQQLQNITQKIKEPVELRYLKRLKEPTGEGGGGGGGGGGSRRAARGAGAGDVFLTRHSNLPDVHVVFHLMVDSHRLLEMTSRHPAILGLRNILKAACCNDITNITLPLLLRHELTEEMTVGWCLRRAELLLKCVKGFVLETATLAGAELRTLTVCLPRRAPPDLFHALRPLLPQVFRLATPLKITNTSS